MKIPLKQCEEKDVEKKKLPPFSSDLSGVKVLLVEDNELNSEISQIQLEDYGMKVTLAKDGKEAVDLFTDNKEGTFDVILMDIMMPNMNGYEATKAIRNNPGRPDGKTIPIIAMTANTFVEDVQASLDCGMNGHLSKPIEIEEVAYTISRNINR